MKYSKNIIKILVLITMSLSLIVTTLSAAQTTYPVPSDYGGTFKAKVGDIATYKVTKVINKGEDFIKSELQLGNGTIVPFTVTEGFLITEKVNETNSTPPTCNILITQNNQLLSSKATWCNDITYSFNKTSDIESFVSASHNAGVNVTLNGDYETTTYNNTGQYVLTVINWKTGWIKSQEIALISKNGTISFETIMEMVTNGNSILGIDTNTIMLVLALALVPVFFGGGAVLALRMKKK